MLQWFERISLGRGEIIACAGLCVTRGATSAGQTLLHLQPSWQRNIKTECVANHVKNASTPSVFSRRKQVDCCASKSCPELISCSWPQFPLCVKEIPTGRGLHPNSESWECVSLSQAGDEHGSTISVPGCTSVGSAGHHLATGVVCPDQHAMLPEKEQNFFQR